MTTTLRAHFDGKVLIPEEPVDLPVGQSIELHVGVKEAAPSGGPNRPLADLVKLLQTLPTPEGPALPDRAAQVDHYLYGTPKRP